MYSIPVEFLIEAKDKEEAEMRLDGFLRFTYQSYFKLFNIDDYTVIGDTMKAEVE